MHSRPTHMWLKNASLALLALNIMTLSARQDLTDSATPGIAAKTKHRVVQDCWLLAGLGATFAASQTLGLPLLRGTLFSQKDVDFAHHVVIVNQKSPVTVSVKKIPSARH